MREQSPAAPEAAHTDEHDDPGHEEPHADEADGPEEPCCGLAEEVGGQVWALSVGADRSLLPEDRPERQPPDAADGERDRRRGGYREPCREDERGLRPEERRRLRLIQAARVTPACSASGADAPAAASCRTMTTGHGACEDGLQRAPTQGGSGRFGSIHADDDHAGESAGSGSRG